MVARQSDNTPLQHAIDSHQHFWQYHPDRHSWISDEMAVIRKDFLPGDLLPVLERNNIAGCVAVQADQTEEETDFLLKLYMENDFITGVVGWVDLKGEHAEARLTHYSQFAGLKGFRHVLQGEDPSFMLQPSFLRGIALLRQFKFTYDILIFPQHLPAALQLVKQFPDQPFVLDHIAKPPIKSGSLASWKKDIIAIAQYPNVHCKISGMVTEADIRHWQPSQLSPYMEVVTEAFGIHRIMYGSDWPVCLSAGSYESVIDIVRNFYSSFSPEEQHLVFSKNASAFYHLT
ncbi:MAG: amidohydrolase family protein [Chitinophagaceae bacterium]